MGRSCSASTSRATLRARVVWCGLAIASVLGGCNEHDVAVDPDVATGPTGPEWDAAASLGDSTGNVQGSPTERSSEQLSSTSRGETSERSGAGPSSSAATLDDSTSSRSGASSGLATFSSGADTVSFASPTQGSQSSTLDLILDAGTGTRGGSGSETHDADTAVDASASDGGAGVAAVTARSGFIDIEALDYVRLGRAMSSTSARLFYSFHPADERPEQAPVFVFFNGGPGYATSAALMMHGTAPMWVTPPGDGSQLVENPWSWSRMGNLLYIDTRQTGFSYSTLPDPSDAAARLAQSHDNNFNDYLDAAELTRVLLRVLKGNPSLTDNPVVLVGESYGGTRASLMLKYLLDPEELRDALWYTDATLVDEIQAHYASIAGAGYADPRDQFQAQILIQPYIGGGQWYDSWESVCAPGTREAQYAEGLGIDCDDLWSESDGYKFDEGPTWSIDMEFDTVEYFENEATLQQVLGVNLLDVTGLRAAERTGAYRIPHPQYATLGAGALPTLGELPAWDTYFTAHPEMEFSQDEEGNVYPCVSFARVLQRVHTFVTDAVLDMVVDTPIIPNTMFRCQEVLPADPFIDSIETLMAPVGDEARPGRWLVHFNASAPDGEGQVTVRRPSYEAGHMVSATQPQQLYEDVEAFLRERGVLP